MMAPVTRIDDAQELRKTVCKLNMEESSADRHCKKMRPIFNAIASLGEYKEVKFCEFDLVI